MLNRTIISNNSAHLARKENSPTSGISLDLMYSFQREISFPTFKRKKTGDHKAGKILNFQHRCGMNSNTLFSKNARLPSSLTKPSVTWTTLGAKTPHMFANTDNVSPPTFSRLEAINSQRLQPCSRRRHS